MAKGFKFPAPAGFAKGGMCKPKGAKGYAKGGKVKRMAEGGKMRSENTEYAKALAKSDRESKYESAPERETMQDFRQRMARNKVNVRNVGESFRKTARVSDETGYDYESKPDDSYLIERLSRSPYAKGGKAVMSGKMKMGRKFAKMADGGEVETEQMARKATRVKMPKGAAPKGRMPRAKSVPVAPRAPVIAPQQPAPMAGAMMGQSPLSRVARARAPMPGAGMGMKMGGKAKKH